MRNNKKHVVFAGICALALAGSALAMPALASTGSTQMYLKADDTQLSVTVPTVLDYAAKADGTFVCPTNATIQNNSVMSVHVSNVGVAASTGVTLAKYASVGTSLDTIGLRITPNNGKAGTAIEIADYTTAAAPAVKADWNMAKADATANTDAIALSFSGKIGQYGALDPAARTQFATVTWTVAAGTVA